MYVCACVCFDSAADGERGGASRLLLHFFFFVPAVVRHSGCCSHRATQAARVAEVAMQAPPRRSEPCVHAVHFASARRCQCRDRVRLSSPLPQLALVVVVDSRLYFSNCFHNHTLFPLLHTLISCLLCGVRVRAQQTYTHKHAHANRQAEKQDAARRVRGHRKAVVVLLL